MDRLTSFQISEWEVANRIDPIGKSREVDFPMAYMAMIITNLMIDVHGKKGSKHVELDEFLPNWDVTAPKPVKTQSVEDMLKIFEQIVSKQNKKTGIHPGPPSKKKK